MTTRTLIDLELMESDISQNAKTRPTTDKWLNLLALVTLLLILVGYAADWFSLEERAEFNRIYADFIFLAIILISIIRQFRAPNSMVDPIYWLLLGAAFVSWFALSVLRVSVWEDLSIGAKEMLSHLAYFFYFALSIAAIEVRSHRQANQLLSLPNMLVWGSSLAFVLGAFMFLVLTPSRGADVSQSHFLYSFVFYILMDFYLCIRWLYLAWSCRKQFWIGYALLAFGALNWMIADIFEGLNYTGQLKLLAGSWTDWVWYTPYIFIFVGFQLKVSDSSGNWSTEDLSKNHLLNNPIFFVVMCFLLERILTANPEIFAPLNSTQASIFNLWVSVALLFAVFQTLLSGKSYQNLKGKLVQQESEQKVLRQRMEQQAISLKNQAASNKAILDTTHNAIFTVDYQNQILSCNPAGCALLGADDDELIGKIFTQAVKCEGELFRFFNYQSYRQQLVDNIEGIEIESVIHNASGEKIPVHVTLSQDQNNSDGLLVISLINISEQKKAEQEEHNIKDQFTANISHEFRTPLTIIKGVLDNLQENEAYQKEKEQVETAKRNVLRMIRMVEQLLELSRIANDPVPISTINVAPVISFVCNSFDEIAKNQNVGFSYRVPQEVWISGNLQAAEKILFNLLSNAFKYTSHGKVKLDVTLLDNHFLVNVQDTGIGIDEEQQAKIFDRFHRVDNPATQSIHGVGIGLALVKELCDLMRWEIQVQSQPTKGTTFTLNIEQSSIDSVERVKQEPTVITQLTKSTRQSLSAEAFETKTIKADPGLKKSKYSVLIVEDNAEMLAHISQILSPLHQCLLAENGEEGIRLAIDYLPDIIVSDVMMPGIDGFELLSTLKKTEMTSHIPIILLTARSDTDSKIKGLEKAADDYISKPFEANELALRVNNQLKSRQKLQEKLSIQWNQGGLESVAAPVED
ncbi:MAG: response regulator, partial [Kangiellaceae bacterium]|nr:response regulator [Kangiellaceae bacterium]